MDRRDNPYAAPEAPTTSAAPTFHTAERIAKTLPGIASLCLAMAPLAFVTLVLMLTSDLENEQYPYGGTLIGEQSGVRMFIRALFLGWFVTAAFTIVWVARRVNPNATSSGVRTRP